MLLPSPPPNWEADEISKFIDAARTNEFATFANLKGHVARLSDIDLAYRKAIEGLNHSKDWFAGFFVLRAHSNFLADCRLCWSGQIPESYAVLRSCLENALYGLYLARNPGSRETWLRRHDDNAKRKVKDEFKIGTMLELASTVDRTEGPIARTLYERTIDSGAHPSDFHITCSGTAVSAKSVAIYKDKRFGGYAPLKGIEIVRSEQGKFRQAAGVYAEAP